MSGSAEITQLKHWLEATGASPKPLGTSWPLTRGEVLALIYALEDAARRDAPDDLGSQRLFWRDP